jgi:N-acetylglutamate synthase-like GNAT family acetyltransferase
MNQIDLKINYLADHMHVLPQLAAWQQEQWGYLNPQNTVAKRAEKLKRRSKKGAIPTTFVGLVEGKLVGSASLVENDLPSRRDLYPWLASVYVVPSWRRKGIGKQLVERVIEETEALGHSHLYLITPDQESFYRRMGWCLMDRFPHRGEQVALMERPVGGREGD